MKKFEEPIVEVIALDVEDVLTTSPVEEEEPPMGGDVGSSCF